MPKKTCELIIASGNEYVIAVKDNQPKLHHHIHQVSLSKRPASRDVQIERTRDRVTQRTVTVFHDLVGIAPAWTGIKSLIKVERVGVRAGKKYHEIVCYISSLVRTAAEFAAGIRGHWGIENRLHCLDSLNPRQSRGARVAGLKMLSLRKMLPESVRVMLLLISQLFEPLLLI